MGISLLTSYEHMGMLDVACSQGCTCNSSAFDTCNPNMAWSEVRWAFHPIQVGKIVTIFLGTQLLTDIAVHTAGFCSDRKASLVWRLRHSDQRHHCF